MFNLARRTVVELFTEISSVHFEIKRRWMASTCSLQDRGSRQAFSIPFPMSRTQ